jgi:hypothetical protein
MYRRGRQYFKEIILTCFVETFFEIERLWWDETRRIWDTGDRTSGQFGDAAGWPAFGGLWGDA